MARSAIRIAALTVILSAWTLQSTYADGPANSPPVIPADSYPGGTVPADQLTGYGYPYLNAPLYPSPQPNVPVQIGSSVYTNQAFAPHEMLYPHTYRAMYPPFFFNVRGKWMVTPWGVWSHDNWVLQGTKVQVKYRSQRPMFSLFCPPVIR